MSNREREERREKFKVEKLERMMKAMKRHKDDIEVETRRQKRIECLNEYALSWKLS